MSTFKYCVFSFFLIFFIECDVTAERKSRSRREFTEDDDSTFTGPGPACDVVCDAQWKTEYHLNFQKLYDTEYFEIPIDSSITKNKGNLKLFCTSTNQKYNCLRRECKMARTPWTPEKHICLNKYDDFERNINCLSLTDRYVQKECSNVCNSIPIELATQEIRQMGELEFSKNEKTAFIEQNQHCHFIACHQMCHEYIINKICIDSSVAARAVVKNYYDSYFIREYTSLKKNDHGDLYSSFCRRVTPGLDENAITPNMTRVNNQYLDRIKSDIRAIFAILD